MSTDNSDGILIDHRVEMGDPPDAPMLVPAVARVAARFNKVPKMVTADRYYGEAKVEDELETLGVKHVAIPRKGRPGAKRQEVESSSRFRKLIKWRTGSEGRISYLKHSWGWGRTMIDGLQGASTWCGWGVLAHNATKISVLIEERNTKQASAGQQTRGPAATGPPGRPPPPAKHRAA